MTEGRYIIEVKRLRSQMVAIAARYLGNSDDAEDITQDALLKLWAMREMLRESEVDRLAFMVLKHLCINELKKREYKKSNNVVSIDSIDVALDPDNPQDIEERERQLMMAVDKLPSKQRQLLHMRYIKGKDVRTIAQITGSSEGSIKMALSRVRNKIYKLMAAVVVAVICIGLFAFSYRADDETSVEARMVEKAEKSLTATGVIAKEPEPPNVSVPETEGSERQPQLPPCPRAAIVGRKQEAHHMAAVADNADAPDEGTNAVPTIAADVTESLDRDMMQAILESSAPERVYASRSQLPDEDVSNRDRLRKKTLAIITLNE